MVLRRFISLVVWFALLTCVGAIASSICAGAQEKQQVKEKQPAKEKPPVPQKQVTAEQVAESSIFLNGTREGMAQIRRTGVERGRVTRAIGEGKTEEATYECRFIRGENTEKDRIRLEQKMPTAEYSLVFAAGQVWGIINDAMFTPRQETTQDFLARQRHGIDTLLRYKENGSTINYIGKDKQKGLDLYVLDVTDKEQRRTRFYISARTARVLWLEYEERPQSGSETVKFSRKFHDYHLAQGTLVPFRTVLYKDGTQIEETQVLTITFGSKIDETLFRNPNSPSTTTASTP